MTNTASTFYPQLTGSRGPVTNICQHVISLPLPPAPPLPRLPAPTPTLRIGIIGLVIGVHLSSIELNNIGFAENRSPFALTNMLYSVLTPGVVYDLKRRKVVDSGPVAPPRSVLPKLKKSAAKTGQA